MVQQKDDSQSHRCSMAMLNPVSQPGTCGWRCCCCCTVPSVLPLTAAMLLYCCCCCTVARYCCTLAASTHLLLFCKAKHITHFYAVCSVQCAKPITIAQLLTLALQSIKTLKPDELHVGDCQLTSLLYHCLVLCWIVNTFVHGFVQQLLFS